MKECVLIFIPDLIWMKTMMMNSGKFCLFHNMALRNDHLESENKGPTQRIVKIGALIDVQPPSLDRR